MNNNNQPAVIINFPETKIIKNIPNERKKEILKKRGGVIDNRGVLRIHKFKEGKCK